MIGETAAGDSDEFRREWIHPVEQVRHRVSLKRILAPTDLTIDSRKALDYAITVAEHFNAQVTLLHAYVAPEPEGYSREINDYGLRTRLGMPWIRSDFKPPLLFLLQRLLRTRRMILLLGAACVLTGSVTQSWRDS